MARVEHASTGFERSKDDRKDRFKEHSGRDRREDDGEDHGKDN